MVRYWLRCQLHIDCMVLRGYPSKLVAVRVMPLLQDATGTAALPAPHHTSNCHAQQQASGGTSSAFLISQITGRFACPYLSTKCCNAAVCKASNSH